MKKFDFTKWLRIFVLILALGVFLFSGYKVYDYISDAKKSRESITKLIDTAFVSQENITDVYQPQEDVTQSIEEYPFYPDFEELQKINKDIIAWIWCEDTVLHYPVVQSYDNEYYLHRLTDHSWNFSGTPFLDYRNNSNFSDFNTIIYAHNMLNGTMFASLYEWEDEKWREEHPIITVFTPDDVVRVKVLAAFETDTKSFVYTIPSGEELKEYFVNRLSEKIFPELDTKISVENKFVTLSTCTTTSKTRFVVVGQTDF